MKLKRYLEINNMNLSEFCRKAGIRQEFLFLLRKNKVPARDTVKKIIKYTNGAVACRDDIIDSPPISFEIKATIPMLEDLAKHSPEVKKTLIELKELKVEPCGDICFYHKRKLNAGE